MSGYVVDTDYHTSTSSSTSASSASAFTSAPASASASACASTSGLLSAFSTFYTTASSALSSLHTDLSSAWADLARHQPVPQQQYITEAEQGDGKLVSYILHRYLDVYDEGYDAGFIKQKSIASFYSGAPSGAPRLWKAPYGRDCYTRAEMRNKPVVWAERYWRGKGTYCALPRGLWD